MATSYLESFHAWGLGLKERNADGTSVSYPVTAMIMARGTDFEHNTEFETDDYEGHSGTKTLVLQSDRKTVTAEPEYSHGVVFGECQEEYWFMTLGNYVRTKYGTQADLTPQEIASDDEIAVQWVFNQDLQNPKPLPRATITNQYMMTNRDAVIFDDCMMNEYSISADGDGITCNPKWKSSAPYMNQPNQVLNTAPKLNKLGKDDIRVYIIDVETDFSSLTDAQKLDLQYDCIMSLEMNFNNNIEDSECLNTEFGKNSGDEGKFEGDGNFELKWNPKSAFLIDEYYAGAKHGVKPTTEPCFKQIVVEMFGAKIGETETRNMIRIRLPKVEITNADSGMSGDETKTLEVEYAIRENGYVSPVETTIVSPLKELHYGSELTIDTSKVGYGDTDIDVGA